MFRTILCPSSGVLHCTHSDGIYLTVLQTACEQDQHGIQFHADPARRLSANLYDIYNLCVYSEELMMDRRLSETCRVSFQNKFEKLVRLVGFIIRNYHDARSVERQTTSIIEVFIE